MDDLVELHSFIDSMSDEDVRRFLAVYSYSHTCQGSRMCCCGESRCESCHITHLRSTHGHHAAQFWAKLSQSERLTWSSRRPDPLPNGHRPKPKKKEVNDPARYKEVPAVDELEALEQALAIMTKSLQSKGLTK